MQASQALDFQAIANILTLRYNPTKPTSLRRLTLADFHGPKPSGNLEVLLKQVIIQRLAKDKPKHIVIPCGSGIDSTLMLALTKEVFDGKITAVSLGFNDGKDETEGARKIAYALDVDCRCIYLDDPLKDLQKLIGIVQEPRYNLYPYYVIDYAKSLGADMLMTGDGGDELFAGYNFRYWTFLKMMDIGGRVDAYLAGHSRDWTPDHARMFNFPFKWSSITNLLEPYFDNNMHPLNQVMMADFNGKLLYDFIPTNQAFYDHLGINAFSPMLDSSVISHACRLPIAEKYDAENNVGKLPLRAILEKKDLLKLTAKDKIGFGMDVLSLYKKQDLTFDRALRFISADWIKRAKEKARTDVRYANKLLMLHALETWLQ